MIRQERVAVEPRSQTAARAFIRECQAVRSRGAKVDGAAGSHNEIRQVPAVRCQVRTWSVHDNGIMGGHGENGLAKNQADDILCSEASLLRAGACQRSSPLNGGRCHVSPRTACRLSVLGKQVIWKDWQKRQTEIFLPGPAGLSMQARDDAMGYTRQRGGAPWG